MNKKELFKQWKNLNFSSEMLVRDFVNRNDLDDNRIEELMNIIDFSIYCELANLDPLYYT